MPYVISFQVRQPSRILSQLNDPYDQPRVLTFHLPMVLQLTHLFLNNEQLASLTTDFQALLDQS